MSAAAHDLPAEHVSRADAAVDAAQKAAEASSAAAARMRDHRDALIRSTGTGPALADRHYRSFAAAIASPSPPRDEQVLQGAYPLVESADESYAKLLAAAATAAAAAEAAQAHRDRLGS